MVPTHWSRRTAGARSIRLVRTTSSPTRTSRSRTVRSRTTIRVREVIGDERVAWWERAVAVFGSYADYQAKTDRIIPVLVAERTD